MEAVKVEEKEPVEVKLAAPATVNVPVLLKATAPLPEVVKLNPAVAMSVVASRVIESLNSVKSKESAAISEAVIVVPKAEVNVMDPPRETAPPPDRPDPGEMVIDELARSPFAIVPSLISVVVIPPDFKETAPAFVTVKNESENDAIPVVVVVAVSMVTVESIVGLCGSPVMAILFPATRE